MQIDLASVDTETFNVSPRGENGEFVLITPKKSKHVWQEDELHLRSLLCRPDGTIVSAGWPKFGNYGENPQHDAEFRTAVWRNAVSFSEKLDGSLVILSAPNGVAHFRTRGNDELGFFQEPIMMLIRERYPALLQWYKNDPFLAAPLRRGASILFEYVAPTNQIVVKYAEPQLFLLGYVHHETMQPVWDSSILAAISLCTGVPRAPQVTFSVDTLDDLLTVVRDWKGKEGVVAGFVGSLDGIECTPRMLKIKAKEYIRLHSLKFRLSGNVAKLAFLLGIRKFEDVVPALGALGIDHEAQQFIKPEMDAYLERYARVTEQWDYFKKITLTSRTFVHTLTGDQTGSKGHRKWYVGVIQEFIKIHDYPACFFPAAMRMYDNNETDANIIVFASEILNEPAITVRQWAADPFLALDAMLSMPVPEEE
jgi:hypothetical protein